MTSEHFVNGARNHRTAATNLNQAKIMTIQINALTAANTGGTETLQDRQHQEGRSLRPRPLADRVPQPPMDLVKRKPSATRRCTSQRPASNYQTQCILRV